MMRRSLQQQSILKLYANHAEGGEVTRKHTQQLRIQRRPALFQAHTPLLLFAADFGSASPPPFAVDSSTGALTAAATSVASFSSLVISFLTPST